MCEHEEQGDGGLTVRCPFRQRPGRRLCALHDDANQMAKANAAMRVAQEQAVREHRTRETHGTGSYQYDSAAGAVTGLAAGVLGGAAQVTRNGGTGERYFTRSEVLTVLRSREALNPDTAIRMEFEVLRRIFTRME